MGKSLADYNIEQSSSSGMENVKWTQRNPSNPERAKSRKKQHNGKQSGITVPQKTESASSHPTEADKRKTVVVVSKKPRKGKKTANKKSQTLSANVCQIEPGFRRPGR